MQKQQYLNKIKKAFPELKWQDSKVITKGWDFVVIVLDNKIIFRFPKKKEDINKLKKEIKLLKYFKKQTRFSVPDYKYVAKDKSFAGYPMIEGSGLSKSRYQRLTIIQKKHLQKKLAKFLTILHTIPASSLKSFNLSISEPQDMLNHLVKVTKKYLYPRLNTKEIKLIEKHFEDLKDSVNCKFMTVVVHGDLGIDHILLEANNKSLGIIDFGDIHFADPAKDFSRLYEYGPKFVNNVYNLYQGPKDGKLLKRALLNYKSKALRLMVGALKGWPITYQDGYKMFKQRFN